MRRIYGRFSELLLADCSHKTNRYNYQLLTFMTMNEFGEGAVVQQSLLEANGDWHMDRAVAHFKRLHPSRIDQLRVIVVDKDLNEIKVLESNFPKARVLVCHFHVIKYLKEKRAKPEYSKVSSDDASQVDAAIHAMVYADSEEKYTRAHASFKGICDRVGLHDFFLYFERNWDESQDRWVLYRRAMLPHFKNHTNNRLENFFGKLKGEVDGSMSMAGCVKALVAYDRRMEKEYTYRLTRIGRFVNSSYDEEMSNVLRFTSPFVAENIEVEYSRAVANAGRYTFTVCGDNQDQVVVQGASKIHRLRLDNWTCDCEFSLTMKLPCRHAMAFRKRERGEGPIIPWMSIDVRWTNTSRSLQRVKQFTYEAYRKDGKKTRLAEKRTSAQRYRAAARATHLICSEMADIEDEDEFDDLLELLMTNWRNVRQRKMPTSSSADNTAMVASTASTRKNGGAKDDRQLAEDAKVEFDMSSGDSENLPDEDEMEKKVPIPGGVDIDLNEQAAPTIRLNPKAKKVGAPRKSKTVTQAGDKSDRKWYQQAEQGRQQAGEVTLRALADALAREMPSLVDTQCRLSGVIVKFSSAESKKPKLRMLKNPVVTMDPFYLLPPKLLDACMKVLSVANTSECAIEVDGSQETRTVAKKDQVETVVIKDVGNYSRKQIENFVRIQNLKTVVQLGLELHKWLTIEGIPALPAKYHDVANQVAAQVLETYPYTQIDCLPALPDFTFSMLYRAIPPTWLSDASIRALCVRLTHDFPSCRFAGFQDAVPHKTRTRRSSAAPVSREIQDRVFQQVAEEGVECVLLPLNFHNTHWCCLVVVVSTQRIFYYDPLNQAVHLKAANAIAQHLKISGLQAYDVAAQNNPIQFDAFSCGIYVCWMFIRHVVRGPPLDMSANALPRRRFELFFYLLSGRLLTREEAEQHEAEAAEEDEKMPAPPAASNADEEEDVPLTQVAK
ncbi:hypothetical protein PF004_g1360 [Phytophthora fragariae]|uniref:SWIM-type domain-containing protein n=2 Tax=Phytophthora fragariae TaxID=53985 RepID=A0A6G0PSG3_9STRA|nr:hypothetical protein PF004_g1360 [Phytophthora fragariae]